MCACARVSLPVRCTMRARVAAVRSAAAGHTAGNRALFRGSFAKVYAYRHFWRGHARRAHLPVCEAADPPWPRRRRRHCTAAQLATCGCACCAATHCTRTQANLLRSASRKQRSTSSAQRARSSTSSSRSASTSSSSRPSSASRRPPGRCSTSGTPSSSSTCVSYLTFSARADTLVD